MTVSLNDLPNLEQLPASLYFFLVDLVRAGSKHNSFCPIVPNLKSNPVQRTQRPEAVFVYWHKLHLRPLSLGEPHHTGGSPPLLSQTRALLPSPCLSHNTTAPQQDPAAAVGSNKPTSSALPLPYLYPRLPTYSRNKHLRPPSSTNSSNLQAAATSRGPSPAQSLSQQLRRRLRSVASTAPLS